MDWKENFTEAELDKGRVFFNSGKAKKLVYYDGIHYSCTVRDDRNYLVSADIIDGALHDQQCGCDTFDRMGNCAHIAALLYLVEKEYGVTNGQNMGESEDFDLYEFRDQDTFSMNYYDKSIRTAFRNLRELRDTEEKERREDETAAYVDDGYSYFKPDRLLESVAYDKKDLAKAKELAHKAAARQPDVNAYFSDDPKHPEKLSGIVYINGNTYGYADSVMMEIDSDGVKSAYCRQWCPRSADKSRAGHTLCVHELAAVLVMQEYLKANPIGDKTDYRTYRALSEMGLAVSGESDRTGRLMLKPLLEYSLRNGLRVSFRIGYEKLYKVTKLEDIRDGIQKGETRQFGKNTQMELSYDYLSEDARKWYSFIDNVLEEQEMQIKYYDSNLKSYKSNSYAKYGSSIPLFGKNLDDFYESAAGGRVESSIENLTGKQKSEISFEDGSLRLHFDVLPDVSEGLFHGVEVKGKMPAFFRGQTRYYYLHKDRLIRLLEDFSRKIRPVADWYRDGDIDMHVGRKQLAGFYRNTLPKLQEFADVEIKDEKLILSHIPPVPQLVTYFDYQDGYVLCYAEAYYGNERTEIQDLLNSDDNVLRELHMKMSYRDIDREGELLSIILEYVDGFDPDERVFIRQKEDNDVYMLLTEGIDRISKISDVRITDRFKRMLRHRRPVMQVGISVQSGLLDLSVTGEDLTQDEIYRILGSYKRKQRFFKLKDGSFLSLEDDETLARLTELMDSLHMTPKQFVSGKLKLPMYRALYIEKMLEQTEDLKLDRDQKYRGLLKEFKTVEDADFEIPEHLEGILRNYQVTGYRWLMTLDHYGFGGILADEMGLGKTLQAIAVMESVFASEGEGRALVVCPASLVYNWYEEITRYAPDLSPVVIAGSMNEREKMLSDDTEGNVYITSYDLMKRDVSHYEDMEFRLFFIDEAQYIKNQSTAAAKSVRLIKAKSRFALTGTPIENRLGELWSIFEFLMPDFLYDYATFRKELETPIVKNQNQAAGDRLKKMVSPFILRRKKADVLKDLPDKLEETRYARMDDKQSKLYDAQVLHLKSLLGRRSDDEIRKSQIEILAELTKMRQVCCDPLLYYKDYKGESAKREMCIDLLTSLADGGHKTLLFSQFTSMLELLEKDLDEAGLAYYKIIGATPKEQRLKLVNQFNQDDTPVFLISLKAGGTGLNLTGADSVIHYDPWWNKSAENQATDRAHRIGQKNVVTVYKLIIKGSIEEKILNMQEEKSKLAEEILSADGISNTLINREALMELL